MEPVNFETWIDDNLDLDDCEDILELMETVATGQAEGRWSADWNDEMLIVTGADEALPLHSRSSRDTFLNFLRQQRNS